MKKLGNEEKTKAKGSQFSSVSHVQLFATPRTTARQASLSITSSQSLLRLMSIESVMPSNHLILCRPLLLPPSIFPSIRVFSSESVLCIKWPKYCSVSFSINPFNEDSGLISFRMDWLDLLAAQGTLRSLLQHPSSKATVVLLTPLPSSTHLVLISLCHVLRLCLSFKDFALNPSHLFHFWLRLLS